jgi:hypothetical protein
MEEVSALVHAIGEAFGSLFKLFLHSWGKIMIDVVVILFVSMLPVAYFLEKGVRNRNKGTPS